MLKSLDLPVSRLGEPGGGDIASRFQVFDETVQLLADATTPDGQLIVIDDLHWSDVSSVRLFQYAASAVADTRLLLVGMYRAGEEYAHAGLAQVLPQIRRERTTSQLTLLVDSLRDLAHEELTLLAADWRELLFPDLDDAGFADAYAQTVTFALLLARVDGISFDDTPLHEIARLLGKKHSLMGRALAVLTDNDATDELPMIGTLRRVIGIVDWNAFDQGRTDIHADLYERFLSIYDPALRRRSGSYYTPQGVAGAMVARHPRPGVMGGEGGSKTCVIIRGGRAGGGSGPAGWWQGSPWHWRRQRRWCWPDAPGR